MWARRILKAEMSTVSVPLTAPKDGSRLTSTRNDNNTPHPGAGSPHSAPSLFQEFGMGEADSA
jgi:hypothetical protein